MLLLELSITVEGVEVFPDHANPDMFGVCQARSH
jgi:hypothetical protein